ncbi:DUF6192 family protein [Streptomyces griseoluteus]|uniref:DUF6192 family protein n=1 Tax=Streptomyces griseoluteus TaxID=29306 RepID=UPI003693DCC1
MRLAEDIGLKYSTVNNARWVSSRWPKEHRQPGVSFTVYRILANVEDEDERFAAVKRPPEGKNRWTADDASRVLGWQVENPVSKQEKISAIHALAQEEEVAAVVTTDLLRWPTVSAHVAGSSLIWLQGGRDAERAAREAATAIGLWQSGPEAERPLGGRWTMSGWHMSTWLLLEFRWTTWRVQPTPSVRCSRCPWNSRSRGL